jgi:hypothetical protein
MSKAQVTLIGPKPQNKLYVYVRTFYAMNLSNMVLFFFFFFCLFDLSFI